MRRLLIILLIALGCTTSGVAQTIAVNTDVAWDAVLAPSLGVEITMAKKSTLNINALYGPKVLGKDLKVFAFQPEWRVYLSGRPMYHFYIGGMGILTTYNLNLGNKVYDGDAFGGGVSFGWVWPVTQRLTIDFHSSLGYIFYRQKEYPDTDDYDAHYTNPEGYPESNSTGSLLAPMSLGIKVAYIIK